MIQNSQKYLGRHAPGVHHLLFSTPPATHSSEILVVTYFANIFDYCTYRYKGIADPRATLSMTLLDINYAGTVRSLDSCTLLPLRLCHCLHPPPFRLLALKFRLKLFSLEPPLLLHELLLTELQHLITRTLIPTEPLCDVLIQLSEDGILSQGCVAAAEDVVLFPRYRDNPGTAATFNFESRDSPEARMLLSSYLVDLIDLTFEIVTPVRIPIAIAVVAVISQRSESACSEKPPDSSSRPRHLEDTVVIMAFPDFPQLCESPPFLELIDGCSALKPAMRAREANLGQVIVLLFRSREAIQTPLAESQQDRKAPDGVQLVVRKTIRSTTLNKLFCGHVDANVDPIIEYVVPRGTGRFFVKLLQRRFHNEVPEMLVRFQNITHYAYSLIAMVPKSCIPGHGIADARAFHLYGRFPTHRAPEFTAWSVRPLQKTSSTPGILTVPRQWINCTVSDARSFWFYSLKADPAPITTLA